MKLSEMSADQAADVLVKIAPEIEEILQDEEILNSLGRTNLTPLPELPESPTEDEQEEYDAVMKKRRKEASRAGVSMVVGLATRLLKDHKQNTFAILAALEGKPASEFGKLPFLRALGAIKDMLSDKELIDFFKQSAQSEAGTQSDTSQK